jgi:CheY-like chemotaxis protein
MPKTILLADDSVTIQKVVGISFANEDVELLTVDNGDDAVAQARERRPDLVLADIAMPGLDGYAVCETLKRDPAMRHVPVLLLSGTFETFDEARAREVGADGHVTKPFEAQALVDRVNDLLARAEASRPVGGAETTVLVSEAPSAPDSFEFFDDELASPMPEPAPVAHLVASDEDPLAQPIGAATVLLDAEEEDSIPLEPVAADPLALEADEASFDATSAPARFDADPMRADAATILFDDDPEIAPFESAAPLGPPPVPTTTPADVAFGTTIESRRPLVETPAAHAATQILAEPDPLDFAFEPEPPETSLRDTAAFDADEEVAAEDELFATAEEAEAPALAASPPPVPATTTVAAPPAPSGSTAHLDALRGELREHLEKVAWEAFGDLSERIVRETVARVEAVAWEVIPQMAEALIREEIRKLQSEE